MPYRTFLEWAAYHELEPWSEERADARAGIIASVLYNVNRRRGSPAKRPRDFFAYKVPTHRTRAEKQALFRQIVGGLPRADPDKS